jgi:hypothetical protein
MKYIYKILMLPLLLCCTWLQLHAQAIPILERPADGSVQAYPVPINPITISICKIADYSIPNATPITPIPSYFVEFHDDSPAKNLLFEVQVGMFQYQYDVATGTQSSIRIEYNGAPYPPALYLCWMPGRKFFVRPKVNLNNGTGIIMGNYSSFTVGGQLTPPKPVITQPVNGSSSPYVSTPGTYLFSGGQVKAPTVNPVGPNTPPPLFDVEISDAATGNVIMTIPLPVENANPEAGNPQFTLYTYKSNVDFGIFPLSPRTYKLRPIVYYYNALQGGTVYGDYTTWTILPPPPQCTPPATLTGLNAISPQLGCTYDYTTLTTTPHPIKKVGIRFHLLPNKEASTGNIVWPVLSYANAYKSINYLNDKFKGAKIEFNLNGLIEPNDFKPVPDVYTNALLQYASVLYNKPNVLNIYVVNDNQVIFGGLAGGYACYPWYQLVQGDFVTILAASANSDPYPHTVAHEVGHYFGLIHTFGYEDVPFFINPPGYISKMERVNQGDYAFRGDQVPDTYPDPPISGTMTGCSSWSPGGAALQDNLGCPLDPDKIRDLAFNTMSYRRSNGNCPERIAFSPLQLARMHSAAHKPYGCGRSYVAETSPVCENGNLTIDFPIEGPTHIKVNGNIQVEKNVTVSTGEPVILETNGNAAGDGIVFLRYPFGGLPVKIIPGGTSNVIIREGPGLPCTITVASNTSAVEEVSANVPGTIEKKKLEVSPVPFTNRLTIRLNTAINRVQTLNIYSANGILLRRLTVPVSPTPTSILYWDGKNNSGQTTPPGVYFIQWQQGAGENRITVKVVKQ